MSNSCSNTQNLELQPEQPGLEYILTDEITEEYAGVNGTAADRINRGLNMIATFCGSVYYWNTKKNKWSARHASYSSEILYMAKDLVSPPILYFNCKRIPFSAVSEPLQMETEPFKCVLLGENSQVKVNNEIGKILSTTSASKSIIIRTLAANEIDLWFDALTTKITKKQDMKPIFHPDPLYRLYHIKHMAETVAKSHRLEQERKVKLIKKDIKTVQNWILELKASTKTATSTVETYLSETSSEEDISKKYLRIKELEEQLEIVLYAISNPNSPINKQKYDVDSALKQIYILEQQKQEKQEHTNLSQIRTSDTFTLPITLDENESQNILTQATKEETFLSVMKHVSDILNPDDLHIDWNHKLDSTPFATIRPGTLRDMTTGMPVDVSVKIPKTSVQMTLQRRQSLLREVVTLWRCNHPNLVKFYGVVNLDDVFGIITERVAGEDLATILSKNRIPGHWGTLLLRDVAKGMDYLHSVHKIKHRNLNPRNILICASGKQLTAKISDFGMVSSPVPMLSNPNQTVRSFYGAPVYAAPELQELDHTTAVDVFSFAYVMWQMYYRYTPFHKDKLDMYTHLQQVREENKREKLGPECFWWPLIERCWKTEPKERPIFKDVVFYLELLQNMFEENDTPVSAASAANEVKSNTLGDSSDSDPKLIQSEYDKWVAMITSKSVANTEGGRQHRIPTHEDIQSLLSDSVSSDQITFIAKE